ncbi:MAG: ATP-binding protein [Candidatus Sumerlaeia bacterium]
MNTRWSIAIIAGLVGFTTLLHYVTDPHASAAHDIYQRIYYLPVILAGLWFGVRGGVITALCITAVYLPHAIHGWHAPYSLFYRIMEIVMFHVAGALTGSLASRERRALREREAAYQRLRRQTEELLTLEEQLRRADRLAALGTLSAGLAHEIRNPLASIKTSLEMLKAHTNPAAQTVGETAAPDTGPPDEQPDFHAILLEETERLNRILDNFLDFARLKETEERGASTSQLGQSIAKTIELLEARAGRQNVRFEWDPEALDICVALGEPLVRQIFLNLFLNAMDAMPQGGMIRVGFEEQSSDSVRIYVEDSGPGVPPGLADRIFDPFFTTKEHGTGLGLSIVARILNGCGGAVALQRSPTPTSRFVLTLPLAW